MPSAASLVDVARRAKVSISTVSRTINGVTAVLKIRQETDRVKILRGDKDDNPTIIIGRPN